MNVLKEIIKNKKIEIERKKRNYPITKPENINKSKENQFVANLKKEGISIIGEIKKKSPSAGIIRENFNHIDIAKTYERFGVDAISILTDEKYFGGKLDYVYDVKKEVDIPVLRKEFIIDEYQIYESYYSGADAVLLIVKALTVESLNNFVRLSGELGLETLVEVHTPDELNIALDSGTNIIGINNRDLDTMKVDITTSLKLIKGIPSKYTIVSESGINNHKEIKLLKEGGFDAFLVGESLMKDKNLGLKIKSLIGKEND